MSKLVQRDSKSLQPADEDLKLTTADLEAMTADENDETLPQSRKASRFSEQNDVDIKLEDDFQDEDEQLETEEVEFEDEDEEDNIQENLDDEQSYDLAVSQQGSVASIEASEKPDDGTLSTKVSVKFDKKTKIRFSKPQSNIQSTAPNYRVTRLFDSISVNRRRRSIAAAKPVLKFQPSYHLESSNPFNSSIVEDLLHKFMEARIKETGKIDFSDHPKTMKICEKMSFDILQKIKAKEYDRYKIMVNVTVIEKFHQSFRQCAGCIWDSETDRMATHVYDRHDFCVITTVFGIYYD